MARLELYKIKFSKLSSIQNGLSKLDLVDMGLGGGFGSIYKANFNNTLYAVKIFHSKSADKGYKTINSLIDKIDLSSHKIDGLRALPLFSFEGRLRGKSVKGYVSYFLDTSKYISLEDILNQKPKEYAKLSFDKRFLLVKQLCEALLELEKISFIHADINAQNILINLDSLHLVVIDFDSGAVTSGDDFIPATFGKLNEWVAPEIREQIIANPKTIKVNIHSDRFSAIVGIHYLLFMQPPYCFVTQMSSNIMRDYLQKYGWSNSPNSTEPYFTKAFPAYSKMVLYLKNKRADFFRALEVSLNNGYFDTSSRVTYGQFLLKIKPTSVTTPKKVVNKKNLPPKRIKSFRLNRDIMIWIVSIFIFGYIFSLGYYFLSDEQETQTEQKVSTSISIEDIKLHSAYISDHYLLGFSDIHKLSNQLVFSYSLIETKSFKKLQGSGYINLKNLKLYLDGLDDIGKVKKDGNAILFKEELFI